MIKNLIFDFGKVLVDYSFDLVIDPLFNDKDECLNFKQVVCSPEFTDLCDKEEIPFEELIADMKKKYPQWEYPLQQFCDRYLEFVTGEIPGMKALLLRLRSEGFKLYGLTNWCSMVYKVIDHYDILQLMDGRIISSEEHLLKPDVAIYQCLCDRFHLSPSECLFTDDKLVNVEGAKAAGWQAIHFQNAQQYERELRTYLRG